MNLLKKYGDSKPLAGAKIIGCIHLTIQTAVLIGALKTLGAERSSPRYTRSPAASCPTAVTTT